MAQLVRFKSLDGRTVLNLTEEEGRKRGLELWTPDDPEDPRLVRIIGLARGTGTLTDAQLVRVRQAFNEMDEDEKDRVAAGATRRDVERFLRELPQAEGGTAPRLLSSDAAGLRAPELPAGTLPPGGPTSRARSAADDVVPGSGPGDGEGVEPAPEAPAPEAPEVPNPEPRTARRPAPRR